LTERVIRVDLVKATSERYLNYALSVITSRALPDVRDGLKPVQRRILYCMLIDQKLTPDTKHKKSAKVVGDVMGNYHPHGDQSIYDALVRLAQPFSLRYPLVDGSGNFGSIDGDRAAAMRYTEVRLRHLAVELLDELKYETVGYRPTYDSAKLEPEVLPTQVPNLLINGSVGIAVGMATNIPPHNMGEVVKACVALIDDPALEVHDLLRFIQAPDFPTGGEILNSAEELEAIYATGSGPIKVRGTFTTEKSGRSHFVIVDSIPYGLEKDSLVQKIGELISKRHVPQFVDVRDESTEQIRVVLELKTGADPEAGMAYLYKHTPLSQFFHVNLTCLAPREDGSLSAGRLNLKSIIQHFLDFRLQVLTKRHQFELRQLEERLHILEGFEIVFDDLDRLIQIIRSADGRQPAAKAVAVGFQLSEIQALAIVDLRLYRISRLEIGQIRQELEEKRNRRDEVLLILGSEVRRWAMVRSELLQVADPYSDPRQTRVIGPVEEKTFDEEVYIVDEDGWVIVTEQGWMKSQKGFTTVKAIRVRENDRVRWLFRGRSRRTVTFFTNFGSAYTIRIADIPTTAGHGDPIQAHFVLQDKERIVGTVVFDPRCLPTHVGEAGVGLDDGAPPPPYGVVATRSGRILRFPLSQFEEPSTKKGRQYCRLRKSFQNDEVLGVLPSQGDEVVCIVSETTRVITFDVNEIPVLSGPGQGVIGIKLDAGDAVLGFDLLSKKRDSLTVLNNRGTEHSITQMKYKATARAGKGKPILVRGRFTEIVAGEVRPVPEPKDEAASGRYSEVES